MRLVKPKGIRSLSCVYLDGYPVWGEGQVWSSPCSPAGDEAEETEAVKVVASGTLVTGTAQAYNCVERQEPHSEDEPKQVFVREPPRYLPLKPNRVSNLPEYNSLEIQGGNSNGKVGSFHRFRCCRER